MYNPTRRDALRAALALAAGALCPSWLLPRSTPAAIPLSPFCGHGDDTWGNPSKYDFSRPFVQAGAGSTEDYSRYATDGHICLRLPALAADRVIGEQTKLPPASGLPWRHDQLKSWRRWPASEPMVASESACLHCDGRGLVGVLVECPKCEGYGCWDCRNRGSMGDLCPECQGNAIGTRPGLQQVGGVYIGLEFDQKIRRHLRDVEYRVAPSFIPDVSVEHEFHCVYLRFAGGDGMLLPLDGARAEERIREAKL